MAEAFPSTPQQSSVVGLPEVGPRPAPQDEQPSVGAPPGQRPVTGGLSEDFLRPVEGGQQPQGQAQYAQVLSFSFIVAFTMSSI